jgi:hypothetical protein
MVRPHLQVRYPRMIVALRDRLIAIRVERSRSVGASGRAVTDASLPAYFDVYPENDNATFEGGTWSNYPYFRQKGVVAVSSIDRGLFILQLRVSRAGN